MTNILTENEKSQKRLTEYFVCVFQIEKRGLPTFCHQAKYHSQNMVLKDLQLLNQSSA